MSFRQALLQCSPCQLSDAQIDRLEQHYDLLLKWNRSLNLIASPSSSDVVKLHFCESLTLADAVPAGKLEIADVGSGAGFPGIPFAVAREDCSVCLIESHQRKAVFLREASRGIKGVSVFAGRAEDVGRRFDWLVGRAVRPGILLSLRIAPFAALLTTSGHLKFLPRPIHVVPIRGTKDRVIALFHVERDNIDSRG